MSSLGDARAKRPFKTSAARQQRERTPSDTARTAHPGTPLVVKGVRPAGRRTRGDRRANANTNARRSGHGFNGTHWWGWKRPVMILPQVHLRKPCYDFSFL